MGADEVFRVEEPVMSSKQNGGPKAAVSISTVEHTSIAEADCVRGTPNYAVRLGEVGYANKLT